MHAEICKNTGNIQFRHIYTSAHIWESDFFFKYAIAEESNLFISISSSWKSSYLWEKWQRTNRNSDHFFHHFQNIILLGFFLFQKWHLSKTTEKCLGLLEWLKRVCSVWNINIAVNEKFKLMPSYSFIQIFEFWPVSKKKEKKPAIFFPSFLQMHIHLLVLKSCP